MLEEKLTLLFHVDDVMLTHLNPTVVTNQFKLLYEVYGQKDPVKSPGDKVHECLGMTIEFR